MGYMIRHGKSREDAIQELCQQESVKCASCCGPTPAPTPAPKCLNCLQCPAPVSEDSSATCGSRIQWLIDHGKSKEDATQELCQEESVKCASCCTHVDALVITV